MTIKHRVLETIRRYEMLGRGDRTVVAVSGGPDSVFLLHILRELQRLFGIELVVAHLDHGIRGEESRRDARFVSRLAKKLGLKIALKRLAGKGRKSKLSPEERLREKRYDFFKKVCRKFKARTVATAHTLDDQAETVLMRVIKGASLKGVIGIHPVRRDGKIRFVRPLIEIEKKEILKSLKKNGIPFRIDRTNLEDRFLRNRVRRKVLPYLGKCNPRIKRALFNLAETLREDFEFIEEEKRRLARVIKGARAVRYVNLTDMLLQPRALRKEIAREALRLVGGNIKKLTFRHWKDMDSFLRTKGRGKSMDLPGGVRLVKEKTRLVFTR